MWAICKVELVFCFLPNGRTYSCRGIKTAAGLRGCSFDNYSEKSSWHCLGDHCLALNTQAFLQSILIMVVRFETLFRVEDLENTLNLLHWLVGVRPAVEKEISYCVAVLVTVSMISTTSSNRRTGTEMLVFQRKTF